MKPGRSPSRAVRAALGAALAACACGGAEDPTNVSVMVDTAVSHQTLVGFGAATAYQDFLLSGRTDDIYQVLFVDSGLDILRLGNWYQNQSSTTTTASPFSDAAAVEIVQKAAAARGGTPPKILMSAWTPPAYLKSNGVTRPPYNSTQTYAAGTLIAGRGDIRVFRICGLVGSRPAGLRRRGGGAGLHQHSERARLLHQPVGDLPVRRHRGRDDGRDQRRRLRPGAGRGLRGHRGVRSGNAAGAPRARDHRLPRQRRPAIRGRLRPPESRRRRPPPLRKHRRQSKPRLVQRPDERGRPGRRPGRPADLHDRVLTQHPDHVRHRVVDEQCADG